MTTLCAQPYDIEVEEFYFDSADGFASKSGKLKRGSIAVCIGFLDIVMVARFACRVFSSSIDLSE